MKSRRSDRKDIPDIKVDDIIDREANGDEWHKEIELFL